MYIIPSCIRWQHQDEIQIIKSLWKCYYFFETQVIAYSVAANFVCKIKITSIKQTNRKASNRPVNNSNLL